MIPATPTRLEIVSQASQARVGLREDVLKQARKLRERSCALIQQHRRLLEIHRELIQKCDELAHFTREEKKRKKIRSTHI